MRREAGSPKILVSGKLIIPELRVLVLTKRHVGSGNEIVFDPYFFVAEKPSPMTQTCTVVNFHNLHSLLGLFGRLAFEQTKSSDWCWFVVKR